MIKPSDFFNFLKSKEVNFYCGVPDSLLKNFCAYVSDNVDEENHIISANEGSAVGLATGYYLSTQKLALVYLQNSGLGNAINPIISLASKKVWSIPMVLIIGWRGSYGKKDEPQHKQQGQVTEKFLKLLGNGDLNIQIGQTYDLKDAARAHSDLENRKTTGSIILKP